MTLAGVKALGLIVSNQMQLLADEVIDVRFWHKADIRVTPA
jgi:hypothetical protein